LPFENINIGNCLVINNEYCIYFQIDDMNMYVHIKCLKPFTFVNYWKSNIFLSNNLFANHWIFILYTSLKRLISYLFIIKFIYKCYLGMFYKLGIETIGYFIIPAEQRSQIPSPMCQVCIWYMTVCFFYGDKSNCSFDLLKIASD
jgi:hypothetical protein